MKLSCSLTAARALFHYAGTRPAQELPIAGVTRRCDARSRASGFALVGNWKISPWFFNVCSQQSTEATFKKCKLHGDFLVNVRHNYQIAQ
jgi:hypothetical protein